jgi:hypothetical protein
VRARVAWGPSWPHGVGRKKEKASWVGPCAKKEGKRKARLGWAAWKKKKRREGRCWAGPKGEKEREREKEMHSNAFEFEFEI